RLFSAFPFLYYSSFLSLLQKLISVVCCRGSFQHRTEFPMGKYIKGKNFPKLFRGGRMMENLWPALLTRLANGINGGLIPWLKPTDGCMKCVIRTSLGTA
ncbi:MAG: hypothetical protein K2P26_06375, partial [Oscillospiraceae bacterium]|nr:hypothetical protein [Oscillospiraceae bacterium]